MNFIDNLFVGATATQYLLVVQPPAHAYKTIMDVKQQFAQKFNCPQAIHSRPNILLLQFTQLAMQEIKIVQLLQRQVDVYQSFMVQLQGFGSQPTHSIFIQVQTKNKLQEITNNLKPLQSYLQISKDNKPFFVSDPYVTVAKKLLPWQYTNAWLQYSQQHFTCSFMVNELLLLKRASTQQNFSIAATIKLLGKQETVAKQVSIF